MKDTIQKLINDIGRGDVNIVSPKYNIIGRSLELNLQHVRQQGEDVICKILIDHFGIISTMMDMALLNGHDVHTNKVKVGAGPSGTWTQLHMVYLDLEKSQVDELHYRCLQNHLQQMLAILDYDGDVESLWQYFTDYNTGEKSALVYRLWQMGSNIENHAPRFICEHLKNYLDGSITHMPNNINMGISLYAKWARDTQPNLLSISPPIIANDFNYVQTMA